MTMDELLRGHDEAAALVLADRVTTRGQLRLASERAARGLSSMGLRRGDALALWLPNGPAWIQLLCAAARIGVLIVPISTRYKPPEVRHLLEVSAAKAIVCPSNFLKADYAAIARSLQPDLPMLGQVIELSDCEAFIEFEPSASISAMPQPAQPDDPLCCFSTSGTTGFPKLAVHGHASIVRHAQHVAAALEIRIGDAMLCALPLFGVFGFMTALGALAGGAACVMLSVFEAEQAAQMIEQHRISHVIGADSMFDAMLQVEGVRFDTLRRGVQADFVGLQGPVTQRADELGIRFTGTYGSSECYSLMAFHPWDAPAEVRARSGGIPIDPLIEVRIVDPETGEVLESSQPGEIQIRGPNVMPGYLNNPEATAKAFTDDGWYRSGDLGLRDGAGFIYLARLGDSLRLRGFLVNPAEIEHTLMQHADVIGAQVVGVHRPGDGDVAVAYVLTQSGSADEATLMAHCRERMAAYKVPVRVIRIDEFPAINGPNGNKIQKRVLREMAREALDARAQPVQRS